MDGEDGAENLIARRLHALVHAREHRGLHEVPVRPPFRLRAVSPAGDAGAVTERRFDVADDVGEVIGRDERPHIRLLIHRVAHTNALDALFNLLDERVVNGARQEQPRSGEADLALPG